MVTASRLQTAATLGIVAAFAAAEACAAYLDAHPASALAWYLTLEVFRPFELARAVTSPLRFLFGPAALPGALAAAAIVLACHRARFRLGTALCANLAFGGALALAWSVSQAGGSREAGLAPVSWFARHELGIVDLLLVVSFAAFAASHLSFSSAIRRDRARHAVDLAPAKSA